MSFFRFLNNYKISLYYISLTIVVIVFVTGAILLRAKSPTTTYLTVGDVTNIKLIKAYKADLAECNFSQIMGEDQLILNINPPANKIQIHMQQSVLDSEPNFLSLKISLRGSRDFVYALSIKKAAFLDGQPKYITIGKWILSSRSELLSLSNLQIYHGLAYERDGNPSDDLIEISITDSYGNRIKENVIEYVEIENLAFIREKEGRIPSQFFMFNQNFIILSLYFFLVLFILPSIFLKKGRNSLNLILILGFLLRISIAPFTSHNFDILGSKRATRTFYEQGDMTLFNTWTSPPLWFFILIGFYEPYILLRILGLPDFRVFYQPILAIEVLFIKLPLILSDVGSTYLIYRICREKDLDANISKLAAAVYMFNPLSIFFSSIWGMFDSLAVFFMLLGFYFLIKEKIFLSSLIWGLGVKWYTLAFIPFLSIAFYLKNKKRGDSFSALKAIMTLAIGFGTFAMLLVLPHILHGDLSYLKQVLAFRLKTGGGGEDYLSLTTFFGPVIWRVFETIGVIHSFPNFFLYIFTPLYLVLLATFYFNLKKCNSENFYSFSVFNNTFIGVLFGFYVTYPQLTPQCIVWIFPLLIFSCFLFRKINVTLIVLMSSFLLPYLDFTYFIIGFPTPLGIASIQLVSKPLEGVFGALILSITVYFLLRILSPKLYLKIGKICRKPFTNLNRIELIVLYIGMIIFLFMQLMVSFVIELNFILIGILSVLTIIVQTVIFIAIEKA